MLVGCIFYVVMKQLQNGADVVFDAVRKVHSVAIRYRVKTTELDGKLTYYDVLKTK